MSRISIIQPDEASGRLKDIYEQLEKQRGKLLGFIRSIACGKKAL